MLPKNRAARNASKSKPKPKPATFRPGSLEEVEYLLEQQVVMAEAAEKLPDSLPLQRQAQDNMVLLRKSLHVWGEKTKALAARPAEPRTLSNEQELAVRRTHNAIVAQIQLHTANGYRAKIPIEGLKDSPELKELEKQVDNLVKLFIEPEEDFGTKKPMWKPKSVLDLDDRDKADVVSKEASRTKIFDENDWDLGIPEQAFLDNGGSRAMGGLNASMQKKADERWLANARTRLRKKLTTEADEEKL